jgi:drug/metabolite transporter (DMT)-like permease
MIGILLLAGGNGGVTVAEHMGVASGVAALAIATVPLFTLLCGYFWGARNTRLEWAGIVLGLIGIAMLNLGSNLQSSPLGATLLVLAAASWAFGSVWSKHLPLPEGAMASAVEMLVGGVVLLIGSALSGEHLQALPPIEGWAALAYLTFFGSIIAFNAYMYLLKNVRPAAATSYAYVNPAVAVLLGIVFVGETIGIEEGLAMLVIISAVVLIGLPQWRRVPEQPAVVAPTESRVN